MSVRGQASEAQLHRSIIGWCRWQLLPEVIVHHSMNEGKRGWQAQAAVKSNGMLKGFPDLLFLHHSKAFFLEVKTVSGRVDPLQISLHAQLRDQGFNCEIVRTIEDAEVWLKEWGLCK